MDAKDYFKHARKGARIERWSMESVIRKQTLGEHQYHVAVLYDICFGKLHGELIEAYDRGTEKWKIQKAVLGKGSGDFDTVLNHDAFEYLTGDLNKRVKNIVGEAWDAVETELVRKSDTKLGDYQHAVEENPMLDFCDAYEALLYCREERELGNLNLVKAEEYYFNKCNRHTMEIEFALFVWLESVNNTCGELEGLENE